MLSHYLKNNLFLFLLFLGFAYAFGVLYPGHYSMLGTGYYVSLFASALAGLAIFFGLRAVDVRLIGFSTITWLGLAFVVSIQPLINKINYPDVLIFPIGFLLLASILSIVVVNLPQIKRLMIVNGIAWCLLVVGLLSAITQYIQLFYPNQFEFISQVTLPISRSEGNIAQPNQASFIAVLSTVAISYLSHQFYLTTKNQGIKEQSKNEIVATTAFFGLSLFILTSAIALTLSRTGLILFAVGLLGSLFYSWQFHKWRFGFFGLYVVVATLGYKFGSGLGSVYLSIQNSTGIDRLMATGSELRAILWERAWLAFSSSPITGIGYNNYLWYGWENIEKLAWFENANHAHNVILQIAAELGIIGLITLVGVVIVLCRQLLLFFQKKLTAQDLFLCILLAVFVAYSFSEFPLWYPFFAFPFVVFVGLLDKGFSLRWNIKKPVVAFAVVLTALATFYSVFYHHYLRYYEIVAIAKVDNQQKIDAYHKFPTIPGFVIVKEHMLHIIVDYEKTDNIERFIKMGDRLIRANPDVDLLAIQARLLMENGKTAEADEINRQLCILEHQARVTAKHSNSTCSNVVKDILQIDSNDEAGYAKRLNDWYVERYGKEP